jgi:putative membrane protein
MKQSIFSQWHFDPLILIFIIMLAGAYFYLSGFRLQKNSITYFAALLLLAMVEFSPLHFLGMYYLFSAHMVMHVVILLLCGPLLVLGLPKKLSPGGGRLIMFISKVLNGANWLAWLAGVGLMWFLHIPFIFDHSFSGMDHSFSLLPLLHSGAMLFAGMIFSWPLFGPVARYRIHQVGGIVYLFTACISCSLLGLLITFAPAGIYQHYITTGNMGIGGAGPAIWGISPEQDQQMAGLIMWVPCCFVYLTGCIYLLQQYLSTKSIPSTQKTTKISIKINDIS